MDSGLAESWAPAEQPGWARFEETPTALPYGAAVAMCALARLVGLGLGAEEVVRAVLDIFRGRSRLEVFLELERAPAMLVTCRQEPKGFTVETFCAWHGAWASLGDDLAIMIPLERVRIALSERGVRAAPLGQPSQADAMREAEREARAVLAASGADRCTIG
jgi:hypothetical protein